MSLSATVAAIAPADAIPGFFIRMATPFLVNSYIVYCGDDDEPGPRILRPDGAVTSFKDCQAIEQFAVDHLLSKADLDELIAIQHLATNRLNVGALAEQPVF